MSLEKLKQLAKNRGDLKRRFFHQEMMKKYSYYRHWFYIDTILNDWRDNAKTSIKQKNQLLRMMERLLLIRCEIELKLPESINWDFDKIIINKEAEIKKLRLEAFEHKKKALKLEEELRLSELDNQSLKNVIRFHEEEK